mmetsp:Transcript_100284/g.146385  ORF Transcript_100284/g.146385 Transcript_100284/m.146385 type:complete len:238 (-) Transcript_100284:414-1127(-)
MCGCLPARNSATKTPSSSALCANMGPATQSPIAKILACLVLKFSPMRMRLALSSSIPTLSNPRSSVRARRPTATRATSASILLISPPAAASVVSVTPSLRMSAAVTLVLNLKEKPRFFLSERWKALMSSVSIVGHSRSENSTTVTLEPRRAQTEPSSSPMTPPPITTRCAGIFSSNKAPVEETQVRSVKSLKGKKDSSAGSEPVAIMVFLALICDLVPSSASISSVVASMNLPYPFS